MATVVDVPKLSPTMETGTLVAWLKKEGDRIDQDELVAEIETDKADFELHSPARGTLLRILVGAGNVVAVGDAVAIVGEAGEDVSVLASSLGTKAAKAKDGKPRVVVSLDALAAMAAPRCKFCGAVLVVDRQHMSCSHCGGPL